MQINKIFISHFHGDHFLGLPGLVQTMQLNEREKPLHIYGPKGMMELGKKLFTLGLFKPNYQIILHEFKDDEIIDFKDYKIKTFKVDHNVLAYGFVFKENKRPGKFDKPHALKLGIPEGPLFSKLQKGNTITLENGKKITPSMVMGPPRPGRKIVISGDTQPCKNTKKHAKDADVLIHEATFTSEIDEANRFGHSTAKQAAEIAKKAKVKKLLLTHISPRYTNHNEILDEAKKIFKKSYVPNDFYKTEIKYRK